MFRRKEILQHKMLPMFTNANDQLFCEVCGGFEGSLTTNCQGKVLTNAQEEQVSKGKLDFVGTRWVYVREAK